MKKMMMMAALAAALTSCKKDDGTNEPATALPVKSASNLFAFDPDGHYTFYSLRTQQEVAWSDSATALWDIALRGTTILINGGTSGPGQGAAAVLTAAFSEVKSAPADNAFATDSAPSYAIPTGSGNGWYNYDPVAFVISPIPGRTLAIRTADGKYAKLEILSYYKDAPAVPDMTSESKYYTFRYSIQTDGSKSFEQ